MLSKVEITLTFALLLSLVQVKQTSEEQHWAPILAESESESHILAQAGPDPTPLGNNQLFFATCNFRGYGTIFFEEKFDPKLPVAVPPVPDITTKRLEITGLLGGLCPSQDYTLSLHKYNCVNCNCKNAGPLIQRDKGIIKTDLNTEGDGMLSIVTPIVVKNFVLIATNKSPDSILGGSCVLTMNHLPKKAKKCKNGKEKKQCKPCPAILCAPIILTKAAQLDVPLPI